MYTAARRAVVRIRLEGQAQQADGPPFRMNSFSCSSESRIPLRALTSSEASSRRAW